LQIRDSIIGGNKCSLAEFTFTTANKYRRGQFDENLSFGYTVHNVILVSISSTCRATQCINILVPQRRFGLDNIDLIKKPVAPMASGDNGEDSDSPTGSKRQRTQVGRIPKGEDFWGKVDSFFVEMVAKFGRDLVGTRWRE
jgi:hypothetical protein